MPKIRKVLVCMCAVVMMLGISVGKVHAEGISTVKVPVQYGQTEARQMLAMINEFRKSDDAWAWDQSNSTKVQYTGLNDLTYDYGLERIAMQRAAEIAIYWSHTRPNGTQWSTINTGGGYYHSENLAAGYQTAQGTFEQWEEEEEKYDGQGHRRNMLSARAGAVGIGHVIYNGRHFWVQEFRDNNTEPAVTPPEDSNRDVEVEVSNGKIASVEATVNPNTYSLQYRESAQLPTVNVILTTTSAWPSGGPVKVEGISWTSQNSEIADIESNRLVGKNGGNTKIVATVLTESIEVGVSVEVKEPSIGQIQVSLPSTSYTYDGIEKRPEVTVVELEGVPVEASDYEITYINNINAGQATVKVIGKGVYAGQEAEANFTINPASIEQCTISSIPSQEYTGEAALPKPVISMGTIGLVEGRDYQLAYSDNNKIGLGKIEVKGIGNYAGTRTVSFTIKSHTHNWKLVRTEAATALKTGKKVYTCTKCGEGKTTVIAKLKPTITLSATSLTMQVKQTTSALKASKLQKGDYIVSYTSSNKKVVKVINAKTGKMQALKAGTATITVKLKSGKTAKCKIKVQKAKVATKSIKVSQKSVTVKKGKTITLKATVSPLTSQSKVTYKSANKKIATVTSKGVVKGIKKGKTKITIQSGKKKVVCTVTVK